MGVFFRRAGLFTILLLSTATTILSAAERIPGTLTVHDSLTSPNQPAIIEATLTWRGLLTETGLGGEPIELLVAGNVVATAMTGGDGRAFLSYTPKAKGAVPFTVRVGTTPRGVEAVSVGNLAGWDRQYTSRAGEHA